MTHARDRILTRFLVATMAVTLGAAHAGQFRQGNPGSSVVAPPSPRDAWASGIGRFVADASGKDLTGQTVSWRTGRGEHLTALALTSIT